MELKDLHKDIFNEAIVSFLRNMTGKTIDLIKTDVLSVDNRVVIHIIYAADFKKKECNIALIELRNYLRKV